VVLRVPATRSDEDLALALLSESGVYVHPGHFYDLGSDRFLVLSLLSLERSVSLGMAGILARLG